MPADRRRFLYSVAAGVAVGFQGCTQLTGGDDGTPAPDGTPSTTDASPGGTGTPTGESVPDAVGLETIADGLQAPLAIAFPPGDLRYVATQPGEVLVHGPDGLRDEPLLDLRDAVVTGGEMGLLGVELHPEFPDDPRLFVRYSAPTREGTPDGYNHTFVVAEFRVDDTAVDPDTERTVLEIPQPQGNHNAGDLAFGPDGSLYVPTGDGGGAADAGLGHPDDWYGANDGGNGQDTTENLLGAILRIDVDAEPTEPARTDDDDAPGEPDGEGGYAVPEDNPLVGREGHRDEYYAWGLRNPWRLAFDDGTLYVADVGQSGWEEVNVVERGGNYGWNVREGSHCFQAGECPNSTPEGVRGGEPLVDPVVEYPNEAPSGNAINGRAVIGGHVYRGSAIPGFAGRYVFGDLQANGRLFVATPAENGPWSTDLVGLDDADLGRLLGFGRDADGELYALGGGGVHRIVPAD